MWICDGDAVRMGFHEAEFKDTPVGTAVVIKNL